MMWDGCHQTVFKVCFVIQIVESFYLQEAGEWTRGETLEESTTFNISEYDWSTSTDVTFTQSTFLVTNSTPHNAEVTGGSFGDSVSTWEDLGSTFEVSTDLNNPSYGKRNDYSQFNPSTTSLTYMGDFESTSIMLEEVTESTFKYLTDLTVYHHTEAVTEEATLDFKDNDQSSGTLTYDSSTNSLGELSDGIETDSTTEEGRTSEMVTFVPATTEHNGKVLMVEDEVSTDQIMQTPAKDWQTLMTVTVSVVCVSVVCLVVLVYWKLRRLRQSRSFTALGDIEIFYTKPREPVILKEELMLYVLGVHLTKSARAKILGEDHPVYVSSGQQELIEEVTSL